MRQPSEQLLKLFGQNVIRLRGIAGFTQEKQAEQAQISWRYFQSIKAGKRWPSVGVLVRLKKALNCEWAELFHKWGQA